MSSFNASSGQLRLDPGPKARRRSRLNWKCLALSFVGVVALLGAFAAFKVFRVAFMPEDFGAVTKMYQDLTVPFNASDVVQPLVDAHQTFDVVVTVWLRQDGADPNVNARLEGGPILSERAIYSDTIFRGLKLEDKTLKTAVELRIPTEIFKNPEIWTYDLRATFVLVPASPSLLDYAVNYSSWIPPEINYPPMRSYREGYSPSLIDRIIDSYGAMLPLLSLGSVNSSCPSSPATKATYTDDMNDRTDEIYDLEIDNLKLEHPIRESWHYTTTKERSALEAHPYIITRSYLRVVDMTRLFNRTEYEKQHRDLRSLSCGHNNNHIMDWRLCWRHAFANQNLETRIKLRKTDPLTGRNTTEWAYAPYLSLADAAWGPLDLVKVPINREECPKSASATDAEPESSASDFVNVVWNIAFSAKSPAKLHLEDRMGLVATVYNSKVDTDEEKEKAHTNLEFINGLTGHRTDENAHPRRQVALIALRFTMTMVGSLLDLYYWFSKASTVGISVQGAILMGGSSLLNGIVRLVEDIKSSKSFGVGWFLKVIAKRPVNALVVFFMLKAALRAELHWYARWIPGWRLAQRTHLERANQRMETKVPWVYKVAVFAALAFIKTYHAELRFMTSGNAGPAGGTKAASGLSSMLESLLIYPSFALGRGLQIALNYRAKTFAGMYQATAPLLLVMNLALVGASTPYVVGNLQNARGVSVHMVIDLMCAMMLTWQALRYTPVAIQEEDENEK
ncbi:hypothetical protein BDN70DRAFT_106010 [Pholiota conissans]|uniref:Uncharacterized protein n=1 Tax=Pholiota conissans TaxID=109636 RepID=A0A9P5ZBF9_9AGAR|nr:hypothetical protein BDN70DRAFT_106010 [Pholiota conissans]